MPNNIFVNPFSFYKALFMLELWMGFFIFGWHYQRRNHFTLKLALLIPFSTAFAAFFPSDQRTEYFAVFAIFIFLLMLFLFWCSLLLLLKESITKTLFLLCVCYTTEKISSLLNTIVSDCFPSLAHTNAVNGYFVLVLLLCDAVVYSLSYLFFGRNFQNIVGFHIQSWKMILLTLISILVNLVLGYLYLSLSVKDLMVNVIALTWNLISCILLLFLLFHTFSESQKDHDMALLNQEISEREQQYKEDKRNVELVNRKVHDMKYMLRYAMENQKIDEAGLRDTLKAIDVYDQTIHTGNEALDTILSKYTLQGEKENIRFVSMIDPGLLTFLKPLDVYVIFGNLIDNAYRAVKKLPQDSQRNIYLKIHQDHGFIVLSVENAFTGEIEFKDGFPRTTKKDASQHGIGLHSVALLAKEYQGTMNVQAIGNTFYVTLLFPLQVRKNLDSPKSEK